MTYLWQKADWPSFSWSNSALLEKLVKARFEQGRLLSLPSDFVHSFEVSDIKKHIYADIMGSDRSLNVDRLHGWQASLFPTGFSGIKKIKIADFRTHDLSASSLPSKRIADSVRQYLHWWHEPPVELDPVLRSAVSFFWFYGISPYEDGNFDLACALSELALQQSETSEVRKYDLSLQIEENKNELSELFEKISAGSGDITDWILYFLDLFSAAVESAYIIADKNFKQEQFWKLNSSLALNLRQRKALNFLLEQGELEMTNRFYVDLIKTSRESAKRDLAELVQLGLLKKTGRGGRSCAYSLNEFQKN